MPDVFTEEARTTLIRETKRKRLYNENEKEVNYGKKTLKKIDIIKKVVSTN